MSSVPQSAKEGRRSGETHTSILDVGSCFTLLSFASCCRLAGLLDSIWGSSRLARRFGGSLFGRGLIIGIDWALSDLAELLQVLLDSAGGARNHIGSELERR